MSTGSYRTATYHGLRGEVADLLDRTGRPLLEADTVNLVPSISLMSFFSLPPDTHREPETGTLEPAKNNPQGVAASVIDLLECPRPQLCGPSLDFTKLNQHTRLWRWIVYSRATTSAIALRWVLPAGFLVVFAEGAIAGEKVSCCCYRGKLARACEPQCCSC